MELIGEHCNNTPCEWLLNLGKGGAHDTSAHHLFDGMPSQPEMPKEDRRISEPVPINTTVNKEEKWLNEALDRILEKFEQMEVKRRCDEKIDRILENLDEIEANRNKFCEEMSASIKATTAALTAASYLPLQEPPSPTPTTCSMRCSNTDHLRATSGSSHIDKETAPSVVAEVGDSKDKDPAPYIVTKDLPKITPARCSTLDLDVNTDIYHAVVVFPLMDSPLELITGFIEPSPVVELKLDSIIGMKKEVPNGCSMKCLKDDNMLLMENPKRNPWPPPWLDGVIRGRDLRPSPWPGFISGGTVEHLVPPWPPPTQISCLALVCYDNGMIFTEMKYINLHWGELKPWPPPNQSDFRHTMVQFEQCQSWKIGVIIGLLAWKKQLSSVNHGSYTTIGNSRMPKLTMEKRSYMLNASDGNGTFWPMGYWQCTSLPIRHIGNYVLHWLSVYMTWPQLRTGRVCSNETKMKMLIYGIHELYKNRCGMIPREGNMHEQGYGYYYLLLVKLFALKIGKQTRFGVLQELKHSLLVLFTQDLGDDEVGQHIILLDCLNLMHCFQLRNNWWLESLSSKPVKLLYELWSLWVSSICVVENKDDFIQLAGHQFTPYMMAQYIEAIEHGLIDGNGWDANNVHDTYGCKERMSVTVILKDGTDIWKLKGIKKSAIKNIISVWKSAFTPAIKSLSQGNKPFCIYKPNVSNCLPCPVAVSTIPGKLKMRNTIVMLVGHHEYYGEGENTKLQLKIVLAGKSNGIRNDLITLIIRVLQVPWDPGGLYFQNFTRHRLEDKSDFKERGLLGSQLEWAFGLMLH